MALLGAGTVLTGDVKSLAFTDRSLGSVEVDAHRVSSALAELCGIVHFCSLLQDGTRYCVSL